MDNSGSIDLSYVQKEFCHYPLLCIRFEYGDLLIQVLEDVV